MIVTFRLVGASFAAAVIVWCFDNDEVPLVLFECRSGLIFADVLELSLTNAFSALVDAAQVHENLMQCFRNFN